MQGSLSILGDVEREEARLEQMMDAIGQACNSRYQSLREETARAKEIAKGLREIAKAKEDFDAAERRFGPWLEEALTMGLDQWRRSE